MDVNNYNTVKYRSGAAKLGKKFVYVEGKSNKFFYQELYELKSVIVRPGGSCINIKNTVSESQNFFGIIDNDYYFHEVVDRIYTIDYYSLENVVIENIPEFNDLKEGLISFYKNDNDSARFKKLKCNHLKKDNRVVSFELKVGKRHHEQYDVYIRSRILSEQSFLKYKDLKGTLNEYYSFYKQQPGNKKIEYFKCLVGFLKSNKLSEVMSVGEYARLKSALL